MMFGKKRVEEDLEKIRRANLPFNKSNEEINADADELKLEKGDIPAMILAIMSLILPYVIAFVGIMAGVVFLLGYLY